MTNNFYAAILGYDEVRSHGRPWAEQWPPPTKALNESIWRKLQDHVYWLSSWLSIYSSHWPLCQCLGKEALHNVAKSSSSQYLSAWRVLDRQTKASQTLSQLHLLPERGTFSCKQPGLPDKLHTLFCFVIIKAVHNHFKSLWNSS